MNNFARYNHLKKFLVALYKQLQQIQDILTIYNLKLYQYYIGVLFASLNNCNFHKLKDNCFAVGI